MTPAPVTPAPGHTTHPPVPPPMSAVCGVCAPTTATPRRNGGPRPQAATSATSRARLRPVTVGVWVRAAVAVALGLAALAPAAISAVSAVGTGIAALADRPAPAAEPATATPPVVTGRAQTRVTRPDVAVSAARSLARSPASLAPRPAHAATLTTTLTSAHTGGLTEAVTGVFPPLGQAQSAAPLWGPPSAWESAPSRGRDKASSDEGGSDGGGAVHVDSVRFDPAPAPSTAQSAPPGPRLRPLDPPPGTVEPTPPSGSGAAPTRSPTAPGRGSHPPARRPTMPAGPAGPTGSPTAPPTDPPAPPPTDPPTGPPLPPEPTPGPTDQSDDDGPGWIEQRVASAIDHWLSSLTEGAVKPLADLAGSLLDPAHLFGIAQLHQLWRNSALVANAIFAGLVLIGGLIVMGHETLQTRYAFKQIAPRLVIAAIAANLSWEIITRAIELAAALAVDLAGNGMTPGQIIARLIVSQIAGGPIFLVLLNLSVQVMVLALVLALIVITALLALLTITAPLALSLHALPQTEAIAQLWWRCLAATLAVPILDGIILALIWRILLQPGGFGVLGVATQAGALLNLLVLLVLLYLMLKIPRWMFRIATGRPARSGPGLVRRVLRTALIYGALQATGIGPALGAVGGAVGRAARQSPLRKIVGSTASSLFGTGRGVGGGRGGGGGGRRGGGGGVGSGRHTPPPGPTPQPHWRRWNTPKPPRFDPYSWQRATEDGQLMLPLLGVNARRRRLLGTDPPPPRRPTTPTRVPGAPRAYRGRQTSLFSRAALTSTAPPPGQTALPIPVTRVYRHPHHAPPAPRPSGPPSGDHPRQLALWRRVDFSHQPEPDGQYALPLPSTVSRVPPRVRPPVSAPTSQPTPPPAPPPSPPRRPAGWVGVQLQFPLRRIPRRPYRNPNPYFGPKGSGR
jgi:uncharacterized membrane protein YgcG